MRQLRQCLFLLVGILLIVRAASAQQQATELDQLRAQIRILDAIQCDSSTSPDVRQLNQKNLERRRLALRAALNREISTLVNYRNRISFLTTAEREEIASRIHELENELNASAAQTACSASGAPTTTSNPAIAPVVPRMVSVPATDHATQAKPATATARAKQSTPAAQQPQPTPAANEKPPADSQGAQGQPGAIEGTAARPTTTPPAALPAPGTSAPSKIRLSPTKLIFERQPWATKSEPQTVTVVNTSDDPVTFLPPEPESPDFQIRDNTCGTVVDHHTTCSFKVVYVPFSPTTPASYLPIPTRIPDDLLPTYKELAGKLATAQQEAEEAAAEKVRLDEVYQAALLAQKKAPSATAMNKVEEKHKELTEAENTLQAKQAAVRTARENLEAKVPIVLLSGTPEHWKHPFFRSVAGLDVSAASSRTVKQKFFIELDLIAPIPLTRLQGKSQDPLESRWWVWTNPRITSLPQATNFSALSTINESGAFFQNLKTQGTVADIAQGLDVSAGLELALIKPRAAIPWWAEFANTRARLAVSLIAGIGVSTPFSTDKTDVPSKVNQSICDAFNNATKKSFTCLIPTGGTSPVIQDPTGTNKAFITFVTPDRSRFFRRYFTGFRLKSYYFSKDVKGEAPYDIFPGIIDLTFGQDEAVTGGLLRGVLFRAEAAYPMPFYQGIHIYASVYSALGRNRPSVPFSAFTIQAPDAGSNNDANTFRFSVPPLNRDYFRIGVGVDVIQVFKKTGQPKANAPSPPAK